MRGLFAKFRQVAAREADPQHRSPPDLSLPAIAASNVVPFVRPVGRGGVRTAPLLTAEIGSRSVQGSSDSGPALWAGFLAVSLLVHGAVWAALSEPPQPLAGIELPAIAVDLVFGADTPAGLASTPSRSENAEKPAEPQKQGSVGEQNPEQPTAAKADSSPAVATSQAEAEPQATASTEPEPSASAAPVAVPALRPEPTAKAEPEPSRASAPKPKSVEPAPKQSTRAARSPSHESAAKQAHSRVAHNNRPANQEPTGRHAQAGGVGRGRSPADANYYGLVAAHLARYKQFPAEARNAQSQGSATVTFGLDGRGRVTSVRLVRGTGVASLDREAQAMVHRASPFPPPPSGMPMTFTVPVSFHIR